MLRTKKGYVIMPYWTKVLDRDWLLNLICLGAWPITYIIIPMCAWFFYSRYLPKHVLKLEYFE